MTERQVAPPDVGATAPLATARFIGTATVLIAVGELRILTDPNFIHRHDEIEVAPGVTTTRQTDPAMELHELPRIDLVVLSHWHADHFDPLVERELDKSTRIVAPPQAVRELQERGFTAAEPLETWQSTTLRRGYDTVRVTAVPGRHGPAVVDFALPDVMGSVLDLTTASGGCRVYVTGDTLIFDDLAQIPERFPDIDVAFLHLGGTRVLGLMLTMDAEQGIEMMRIVRPEVSVPIHYDDYDVFKSPLADFEQAVRDAGMERRVRYLARGEQMILPERRRG